MVEQKIVKMIEKVHSDLGPIFTLLKLDQRRVHDSHLKEFWFGFMDAAFKV